MAKKKTTAVAKTAKVAKTPAPAAQKAHGTATAPAGKKHAATTKKHKATAKHAVKTGLALAPGDVACCAAQALASSLRLALGVSVHDEDVLALYWRTADDPDTGASLLATLEAAHEHGLGGWFPEAWRPAHHLGRPALLRLDLEPGQHAVTAAPDGTWWSWGEPYSPDAFSGAVIEECLAVTW